MIVRIRRWLARWLCRLAHWIDVMPTDSRPSWTATALLDRARALTDKAEELDASGEYKRHSVYAALIKAFPDARKKDLALAIEQVLQE